MILVAHDSCLIQTVCNRADHIGGPGDLRRTGGRRRGSALSAWLRLHVKQRNGNDRQTLREADTSDGQTADQNRLSAVRRAGDGSAPRQRAAGRFSPAAG